MLKPKPTKTELVLSKLPQIYKELSGRKVSLNGDTILIRCRVNNLASKPPLFMWNLTRMHYVSSLKLINEKENVFFFDVKENEETEGYYLKYKKGEIVIDKEAG